MKYLALPGSELYEVIPAQTSAVISLGDLQKAKANALGSTEGRESMASNDEGSLADLAEMLQHFRGIVSETIGGQARVELDLQRSRESDHLQPIFEVRSSRASLQLRDLALDKFLELRPLRDGRVPVISWIPVDGNPA